MCFTVFLILFLLIGYVSAANDNITTLGQDTYNEISHGKISEGTDDSILKELENEEITKTNCENTTLKTSVSGDTFADVQTKIDIATSGDTIELNGTYKGSGTSIIINKNNLTIVGNDAILDAQGQSRILNITGTGVILKNIKFINGDANDKGGAVYWCGDNGIIDGCNFANNTARDRGGAIFWYGINGTISNSNFANNTAHRFSGGAIQWDSNSANGTVNNCNFTDNQGSQRGGAIYWNGANGRINNSNFVNNTSIDGGALFCDSNAVDGSLNNSSFIKNNGNDGGAIYWEGEKGIVNHSRFINNTGSNGGAINWQKRYGLVNNCNFINNQADNGGAVFWEGSNSTLATCNFTNNHASNGGAIYWYAYNGITKNSSFANNQADNGGAINWQGSNGTVTTCNFTSNIVESNGGAIYWQSTDGNISGNFKKNSARGDGCGGAIYFKEALENINIVGNFTNNYAKNFASVFQFLNSLTNVSITGNFINNTGNNLINSNGTVSNSTIHDSIFINNSDINANIKITNSWFGNNQTNYNIKPDVGTDVNMTDWLFLNATYNVNTTLQAADVTFKLFSYDIQVSDYNNSLLQPIALKITSQTGIADKTTVGLNETLRFIPNDIGNSELTASFENIAQTVGFEFKKENMVLTINVDPQQISYGENVIILINYPDTATGKINITLTGKKYIKIFDNLDLKSTITLSEAVNPDEYEVTVVYLGNTLFNNVTANATLKVNKIPTTITATTLNATYNVNKKMVIALTDNQGNPLRDVQITLSLNGVKKYTTDKNGKVIINVAKLVPKSYTAKITFKGNDYYAASTGSAKITVKKAKSIIIAKMKTFKKSEKIKKYTITLKSGKTPIKKVKVTLKLKKTTYKAKTNNKGKATFKIKKLTKKATYKATIKFKGSKYYKPYSKKVKIKIK